MKALVTVLDWGLGHATRSVPIIGALLEQGITVMIGGSGDSLALLRAEFPSLDARELPGYEVTYPRNGNMAASLIRQLPRLLRVIAREHQLTEEIIQREAIDLVISDNRYGCWSSRVPTVFITHQTTILLPRYMRWLTNVVAKYNGKLIDRFTQCWIPDYPGAHSLAGRLTHLPPGSSGRYIFIGNLSRFTGTFSPVSPADYTYDIAVILSGPEPQRTMLEDIVLSQLPTTTLRAFIVRGTRRASRPLPPGVPGADVMQARALEELLGRSSCVLARSGYSTIMDLAKLGKKAIFIPTPGQTEQEYLARRLKLMKLAYSASQRQFNLKRAWKASRLYSGFNFMPDRFDQLNDTITRLLVWMQQRTTNKRAQ